MVDGKVEKLVNIGIALDILKLTQHRLKCTDHFHTSFEHFSRLQTQDERCKNVVECLNEQKMLKFNV